MSVPTYLHPFAAPRREDFLTIVRGEGARVFDADGKGYVDALASLWFCNVGHGRQDMADAIAAQAAKLAAFHTFERFSNEPCDALAERIAALSPLDSPRVHFTCSGSESVDTALKLARLCSTLRGEPDRQLVVARTRGYHGVTYGGMSLQGLPPNRAGFGPLVGAIEHVDHDDVEAVEDLFEQRGAEICAVIAEPVIGAGGVFPPAPGYLTRLRELCDEHGALLIFDEVVCAFGRLGAWFGAVHFDVVPDMITFAKAVTSGYVPLGGVVVGAAVRELLERDEGFVLRHGHTYGGHALACAAALANLDILEREGLLARAVEIGDRLEGALDDLCEEGVLGGRRGAGAVWAAEMPDGVGAVAVRDRMLALGVIPRPLGPDAVAFCPPLVIGDDDLARCTDALAQAVRAERG